MQNSLTSIDYEKLIKIIKEEIDNFQYNHFYTDLNIPLIAIIANSLNKMHEKSTFVILQEAREINEILDQLGIKKSFIESIRDKIIKRKKQLWRS
jgi:hypothetical protein